MANPVNPMLRDAMARPTLRANIERQMRTAARPVPAPPSMTDAIRAAALRTAEAPTGRMAELFHADHAITPATLGRLRVASAGAPAAPSLFDAIRTAAGTVTPESTSGAGVPAPPCMASAIRAAAGGAR